MADIHEYTDAIAEARYGEEVRGSIINALEKVNDDNNKYIGIKDEIEGIYSQLTNCPVITLLASGWVDGEQTVTVEGILADESKQIIEIIPAKASIASYLEAKVYCSTQGEDELTFTIGGDTIPTSNLNVYVATRLIFDGNVDSALDNTSTNPVQNKVIADKITEIEAWEADKSPKIINLENAMILANGKINTLETKEAEDRYNNIPVDNSELAQSWTQYIKLTRYVFDNIAPFNWDNLITAETDGYLYISTSDISKIRMTARLYPADYTGGGYITSEMGDSMIAMPSISIGAYNPTPLPGETDVQVTSPSTACIYVRKGMKIGLFREYDDGYSNTYSADFTAKPFFSNLANAIFYPLVESMEVEE
jgi:hypothetical protein